MPRGGGYKICMETKFQQADAFALKIQQTGSCCNFISKKAGAACRFSITWE